MAQKHKGTGFDRYPAMFRVARARFQKPARVLSFGCSSGEEMLTVRHYYPDAEILGCDIDMTAALARDDLPGRVFFSTPEAIIANGPYDIIFANSVLCLHDKEHRRPDLFPFAEFCEIAEMLHRSLAPHGLLCAYNTSYMFRELPFAAEYRPIRSDVIADNGFVYKWHSSGVQLSTRKGGRQVILRPRLAAKQDFLDCIFEKAEGDPVNIELSETFDPGMTLAPPRIPLWRWVFG